MDHSQTVTGRVAQSARGLELDSDFHDCTGSAAQKSLHLPTQLQLPPEVGFTGPNPGSIANSEQTDLTDRSGTPCNAESRPVLQVARAGATAPVPDNTRPQCPSAPTSAEIRSNLTFLGEFATPRETDVIAMTAASTREVNASASPEGTSAPEAGVGPCEAAAASVATIDLRAQLPACAPAVSALLPGVATGFRQRRTEDEECQVRVKHVTYCCICDRWPGDPQEVTSTNVEAVFCGTCPRKFCLSCLNLSQTPDTLGWEARFDNYGDFQRIPDGCTNCRQGNDREVPADIGESHGTAITEVLKVMLQWLGNHDLARFFREDVNLLQFPKYKRRVKKPMSLAKIRDQLKEGYYAFTTKAGMRCFLQDLSLIESNCIRFNGSEPGISRSAATLSSRSYLFYQSHIEPIAAKLGFPHMLGENSYDGRIWVADSVKAAGRGRGDQNAGIDGAVGGTGDRESTSPPSALVVPQTSSRPDLTEPSDRASTSPPSHAQSAGILSPRVLASLRGASAESSSNVDPSAAPITADNDQAVQDDSVAFRYARVILAHGERIVPMHGETITACPEPPRKISKSSELNGVHDPCLQLGSRVSRTGHSGGGVSRSSAISSDGFRITRSSGRLRSMSNCRVHTRPDEATSARESTGADIQREERAGQHENGDRPGSEGFGIQEIEQMLSSLTLQPAEAKSTSVRQQAGASAAAAEGVERPTTTEVSTAVLTTGSTRLEPHFETDRSQSGAAVCERFSKGQVVWAFHCFAADIPPDGWVEEEMHVPGVVTAIDKAVGTSPAMFTIDLFGREPAVLQNTADKISLFPMEGDLDSARSAVNHGLRPEKGGGINYLNMVVAQAMMTCIDSGWNSTTGSNIYHKKASSDDSDFYTRTKEYGLAWGIDNSQLKQLMWNALQAMGQQKATADGYASGHDSRVLGAGGDDGIDAADPSFGRSGGDGHNSVDGGKGAAGAAAGAVGGEAWAQVGSRSSPARPSGSQDTGTTRSSALQVSEDDVLVDAGCTCDSSSVLYSAAEEKAEPPAQSPPSDGTAAPTPTDERIKLPPHRSCFDTPPLFNETDFEDRSMNPGRGNQASLSDCPSLRGR